MQKVSAIQKSPLIAACGLFCTNCTKYAKGKCPGCIENVNASWCKIRRCCIDKRVENCATCDEHTDPKKCKIYTNGIARTIEFFSGTDRSLCIKLIREHGSSYFIDRMRISGKMSLPKQKHNNKV